MAETQRTSVDAKAAIGVAIPLVVLAIALASVDFVLLAGAVLTLGAVFAITYTYARFVEAELASDAGDRN